MIPRHTQPANAFCVPVIPPPPTPAPDEAGTCGDQILCVSVSLDLAEENKTTAATEWDRARRMVLDHVTLEGGEI